VDSRRDDIGPRSWLKVTGTFRQACTEFRVSNVKRPFAPVLVAISGFHRP
jgi:hypothetical protein